MLPPVLPIRPPVAATVAVRVAVEAVFGATAGVEVDVAGEIVSTPRGVRAGQTMDMDQLGITPPHQLESKIWTASSKRLSGSKDN